MFCCMTLRRFPWKAPRLSDNSYRLFVSTPDPDQDRLLDQHRRSVVANSQKSAPTSRRPSQSEEPEHSDHKHHHHHHSHKDEKSSSDSHSRQSASTVSQADSQQQPTIKGAVRLLRLLPRETRSIIGRMLELDPKKRATMDEILADPWVQNSLVCRQEENGVIIRAPNHTHTLQPSNAGH